VRLGAVRDGNRLLISLSAKQPWTGKLLFDRARHKDYFHLPLDYPRINQFPEWFTVSADKTYTCTTVDPVHSARHSGQDLLAGMALSVPPNREVRLIVE
jgi:hypothetical protein